MTTKHATEDAIRAEAFSGAAVPPKSRPLRLVTSLYRLTGPKISSLFAATIPIGLILGAVEVLTAYVLYLVLARFHLVAVTSQPTRLESYFDPLVLLAGVTIFATLMRYLAQTIPSLANAAFESRIRQALANVTLNGSGEESGLSVVEVSHLVNTVAQKSGVFLQAVMVTFGVVSVLMLIAAELVHLSWKLTALSFIGAALLGFPVLWLKQIYGRFSDRAYEFHRAFSYRFLKDVRNVHFLKLCGINRIETARLQQMARSASNNGRRYVLLYAVGSNLPFLAGAFLIGGLLWANDQYALMSTAGLIPFVYLLNRTVNSSVALSAGTGNIRELLPYVKELAPYSERLFPRETLAHPKGGPVPVLSKLEIRNLAFGRRVPLASRFSFEVRSGGMVLISGPSGRGKTTLLMTLLGLIPKLGGEIVWGGTQLEMIDPAALRQRIGYAGPEPYLIDAPIRANLLFGLDRSDVSDSEIKSALHIACAEFVHDLEGGIDYELREHGDGISAGQKQRLALARSILRRPEVLILDEATANIDEDTERKFFNRLMGAHPELIIVAVSHRSSLRNFATRFIEI